MSRRRRPRSPRSAERGSLYPTLDLHGETAENARCLAERWMSDRVREGERWVRLITGRGVHSRGRPVLREEIEHLLRDLSGSLVRRVEVESGGGALRVELRSPLVPPAPSRRAAIPGASPELRREAEEALAELGIKPTPELLAAEIRRLREERRSAPPSPS